MICPNGAQHVAQTIDFPVYLPSRDLVVGRFCAECGSTAAKPRIAPNPTPAVAVRGHSRDGDRSEYCQDRMEATSPPKSIRRAERWCTDRTRVLLRSYGDRDFKLY